MSNDEDVLHGYHRHAGRTREMLAGWIDSAGRSSYDLLVVRLRSVCRGDRVLDLACGDGALIARLWADGFRNIEGLDQSEAELREARTRLDDTIRLHHVDARKTGLRDASFDVVVSHMAIMLIAPVDQLVQEMGRICKPGGLVLALLTRPFSDPVIEVLRRGLPVANREAQVAPLRLGDPRTMSADELLNVFVSNGFDPASLRLDDGIVRIQASPEELWARLAMMYDVARLPAAARQRLGDRVRSRWRSLAGEDGSVVCSMGIRVLEARTIGGNDRARSAEG